jgi:TPR repeat protein
MGQLDKTYIELKLSEALAGDADALYDLGLSYSIGRGVLQDLVEAHKWFNLAVMNGNKNAQIDRAEVAEDMSFSEIAEAQRKAREWVGAAF